MKKYWKFIKKQAMPQLQLQNKKMPMTQINKATNSLKFIHSGQGNQVSAARTSEPLPSNSAVVYFEAYVRSLNARYEAGVGVIQKDCALKRHPGSSNMSVGYWSNGDIWVNGKKLKRLGGYKAKSTVGIGVIFSRKQVFFTHDGKLLDTISFQYNSATWSKFYPCLSLRSQNDLIQLRMKNFLYNFEDMRSIVEQQCAQQIQKLSIQNINIYSLIGDYLRFHGYKQTYTKLKQSCKFKQIDSFVEHPFFQSKIKTVDQIKSDKVDMQIEEREGDDGEERKMREEEAEEDMVLNRKCSTRQRIMSDYWGDILPNQVSKKRVYEQQRLLLQSRRKSSVISNFSNDEIQPKNMNSQNNIPQIQSKKSLNSLQRFLVQTRIVVLKLIRQQKIQEAHQILQENIPNLFETLDYLQSYFYMHIYIRTLKNEGATKAVKYLRGQNERFQKLKQQPCPVYSGQGSQIKFVQFSHIISLVSLKPGTQNDILSSKQFYTFSNYVNELILKNMGFYPESRLDTLLNHLRSINKKNQQYQINGLTFTSDI